MNRAVIYTRVSTSGQEEKGTSLEHQYATCRQKADQLGLTVIDAAQDVESGASYRSRSGLQKALALLESGQADTLIIYDMSRFSRDVEHQQIIARRVSACNAKIVFCTMDFGDPSRSAEAKMAYGMTGVFAEYERLKIRERTHNGRVGRAKSGKQPSRAMYPYGYIVVTSLHVMDRLYEKDEIGTYKIVPEQAKLIKQVFERIASGRSLNSTAKWLRDRGIPSPRGGATWSTSTIRNIIRNPAYKGEPQFGRLRRLRDDTRLEQGKGAHYMVPNNESEWIGLKAPAIVSKKLWQQANEAVDKNQHYLSGNKNTAYLLRGLLRCPVCGYVMIGHKLGGRKWYKAKEDPTIELVSYYRCSRVGHNDPEKRCPASYYRARDIEENVLSELRRITLDEAALTAYLAMQRLAVPQGKAKLAADELESLRRRQDALIEAQLAAIDKGISTVRYEEKLVELQPLIDEAQRRAQTETVPPVPAKVNFAALKEAVELIIATPAEVLPNHEKNRWLRLLISHIKFREVAKYEVELFFK